MFGKSFYLYIFAFLGGVLYHSLFLNAYIGERLLFIILSSSFFLYLFGKRIGKIIGLVIVIFIIGFLRFELSLNIEQKHNLDYFATENIEISLEGEIIERPVLLESYQNIIVDIDTLVLGADLYPIESRLKLKTYDLTDYSYGQKIRFTTTPTIPESFDADGGRIFDYEHFLEKDSIYYSGTSDTIIVLEDSKDSFIQKLYSLKDSLLEKIYRFVPRPESSLLSGVLLGEKTALGDELEDDFRTTGIMHIVVLSGYNVSLVIMAVMIMLRWLPLYTRSIIAIGGIVIFALLVGAGPTVVRASIMALFIVLGRVVGRPYEIGRALLIAAVCMVIYNPWVLLYDISFQFSFLATYGLIVLSPLLENKLTFIPKLFMLRESAVATIAAQIMVAPLILFYIGDFSIVSVAVNMLILFMVPVAMLLGFLVSVFGFLSPLIAHFLALPTTLSLKYILSIVDIFADIPFAKISVQSFSWVWIFIWYIIIFIFIYKKKIIEFIQKK